MLGISSIRKLPFFPMRSSLAFAKENIASISLCKSLMHEDLNPDFLKNIVCPLTKKPLRYDKERQLLINDELSIGYKIEKGIPNMIPTEAVKLSKS